MSTGENIWMDLDIPTYTKSRRKGSTSPGFEA